MTLEGAKTLLGENAKDYSDEDIRKMIDFFNAIAVVFLGEAFKKGQ